MKLVVVTQWVRTVGVQIPSDESLAWIPMFATALDRGHITGDLAARLPGLSHV